MAKTMLGQFSFNRGEIEPALHGRSDWKYYFSSAARLKNLIVKSQGGAIKRPGLRYVADALNQAKPSFFIPFTFSTKQSYMLEFGDFQMRILMNGELVAYPEGHARAGQVVVIATPYSSDDLPLLRHAQTADIMRLTISSHRPRVLKRYDHHDWRFEDIDFGQSINPPTGLRITVDGKNGAQYCVTALKSATEQSSASDVVTCTTASGVGIPVPNYSTLTITQCRNLWVTQYKQTWPPAWDFWSMTATNMRSYYLRNVLGYSNFTSKPDKGRTYGYRPDGVYIEMPTDDYNSWLNEAIYGTNMGWGGVLAAMRSRIKTYVDNYNADATPTGNTTLAWNAVAGATGYYVFRSVKTGTGTTFYYIGTTAGVTFNDNNRGYDSTRGLPSADGNPFDQPGNYPGVCAFFEQRVIYGRTDNEPMTIWGSAAGNYNSFQKHTPIEETDSYEFTMDSGEMNEINWIIPINELLLGTAGSEWRAGGGGQAITPLNINMRPQSWTGCAPVNPVVSGRTVVYVTRSRKNIRTFSYSLEADGYAGRDITGYAGHLFEGSDTKSITYQQLREGLIWVVQEDGSWLSGTFNPDEDVIAWTRHETRGKVESCGALKDDDGIDQLYVCVAREINGQTRRLIEILEDPPTLTTDIRDMFFVDSGLSANFIDNPTSFVAGLDHLEGERVVALADGNVVRGLKVENGRIDFPGGQTFSNIHVGLPYEAELVTLEMEPMEGGTLANRRRWVVSASIRFLQTRQCFYASAASMNMSPIKFRTEGFDLPIEPFTGIKTVNITMPRGAESTSITLLCEDPVPFGVLGIVAEAGYGQTA